MIGVGQGEQAQDLVGSPILRVVHEDRSLELHDPPLGGTFGEETTGAEQTGRHTDTAGLPRRCLVLGEALEQEPDKIHTAHANCAPTLRPGTPSRR